MNGTPSEQSIICIGSPVVDQIVQVPESFLQDVDGDKGGMELVDAKHLERLQASLPVPPMQAAGGSAGNTAFALARLNMPSRFLGMVGADAPGTYYRELFRRFGGDDRAIRTHGSLPTAQCLSLVTPDGERTMRTHLGAATTLNPEDITVEDFQGSAHAHVEGYLLFNPDLITHVLHSAKAAGCSVSLDLASFEVVKASQDMLPGLLDDYVDIIFANEEEAEAFAGDPEPEKNISVLARHAETVAVKLGARGALLRHGDRGLKVSARPVDQVVDTTGAGDLWAAGFLFGLFRNRDLDRCGEYGAALGSAVVTCQGASLTDEQWDRFRVDFADC